MDKVKIVFVILHYLAADDTIECINSILENVKYADKSVVVVDNASPNDSFGKIKNTYAGREDMVFIQNEENLGFARGNNVGFLYAKKEYNADFIVMLNNDTIITQPDFCEVIISKYDKTEFSVLGPDILSGHGYHQNPMKRRDWTVFKLRLYQLRAVLRLIDAGLLMLGAVILRKKKKAAAAKPAVIGDITGVLLNGSCLIFSPIYIERFDGLDPRTFLYMEEDLLKMHMDKNGLKMLYSSDLRIFHKESVSSDMLDSTEREREIRRLLNNIHSIDICIECMKEFDAADDADAEQAIQ